METCTATPDSWIPTPLQPSLASSVKMLNQLLVKENTTSYASNVDTKNTTTQAAEPALDVEAAVSAAKHVFVTKNKKNQSTQTN
jgi:hypothetical protein